MQKNTDIQFMKNSQKVSENLNTATKKETRGGTRQGSGAKPKYNEETKTVAFRCPLSKVDELKIVVKSKLSEWSVKKQLTYNAMKSSGIRSEKLSNYDNR
jgi:hypothetical protein